jgi:hypothetical protein
MFLKHTISIVVLFVASLFFLFPTLRTTAKQYNEKRLIAQAQVTFQIPSPSHSQIQELESNSFIQRVFPYYDVFATVKVKNRRLSNYYAMLIDDNSTDVFPLTQSALRLEYDPVSSSSPGAFVDYAFSKEYDVSIGDELTIEIGLESLSVVIAGIVLNCVDYLPLQNDSGGALIIAISPKTLSNIAGKTLHYSGAFLRVNDKNKAKEYLQNYKPLGLFRERSDFKTDEDYQKYIRDFTAMSYEAEIRDLTQLNNFLLQAGNTVLDSFPLPIIVILCLIIITIVSFSNQDIRHTIRTRAKNGEKETRIAKSIRASILAIIYSTSFFYILILAFVISRSKIYCPILFYFPTIIVTLGGILVISHIFANLFAKKTAQKYTGRVSG